MTNPGAALDYLRRLLDHREETDERSLWILPTTAASCAFIEQVSSSIALAIAAPLLGERHGVHAFVERLVEARIAISVARPAHCAVGKAIAVVPIGRPRLVDGRRPDSPGERDAPTRQDCSEGTVVVGDGWMIAQRIALFAATPLMNVTRRSAAMERVIGLRLSDQDALAIREACRLDRVAWGTYLHWYVQKALLARELRNPRRARLQSLMDRLDQSDYSPLHGLDPARGWLFCIPHHGHYVLSMMQGQVTRWQHVRAHFADQARFPTIDLVSIGDTASLVFDDPRLKSLQTPALALD